MANSSCGSRFANYLKGRDHLDGYVPLVDCDNHLDSPAVDVLPANAPKYVMLVLFQRDLTIHQCMLHVGRCNPPFLLRPWWNHDYHFHVRIRCPADIPDCHGQPPAPPGTAAEKSSIGGSPTPCCTPSPSHRIRRSRRSSQPI